MGDTTSPGVTLVQPMAQVRLRSPGEPVEHRVAGSDAMTPAKQSLLMTLETEYDDVTIQRLKRVLQKRTNESQSEIQTVGTSKIRLSLKCPISMYKLDSFPIRFEGADNLQPISGVGVIDLVHSKIKRKKDKPGILSASNSFPKRCPLTNSNGRILLQSYLLNNVFRKVPFDHNSQGKHKKEYTHVDISLDQKDQLVTTYLTAKDIHKLQNQQLPQRFPPIRIKKERMSQPAAGSNSDDDQPPLSELQETFQN